MFIFETEEILGGTSLIINPFGQFIHHTQTFLWGWGYLSQKILSQNKKKYNLKEFKQWEMWTISSDTKHIGSGVK